MPKKYRSKRIVKKGQSSQSIQTILFLLITLGIIISLLFFGLPALTKFALFLGDIKETDNPISKTDKIPPTSPILNSLSEATASSTISISGYAESGSTVELFQQNRSVADTLVSNSGLFEFFDISLDEGSNSFYVIATDSSNNTSPQSSVKKTILDTTSPEINISSPENSQVFYGNSERTITVSGSSDPDTSVSINDRLVITNPDGTFSTKIQLEEGENKLTILATDQAGNTSEETISATFRP